MSAILGKEEKGADFCNPKAPSVRAVSCVCFHCTGRAATIRRMAHSQGQRHLLRRPNKVGRGDPCGEAGPPHSFSSEWKDDALYHTHVHNNVFEGVAEPFFRSSVRLLKKVWMPGRRALHRWQARRRLTQSEPGLTKTREIRRHHNVVQLSARCKVRKFMLSCYISMRGVHRSSTSWRARAPQSYMLLGQHSLFQSQVL